MLDIVLYTSNLKRKLADPNTFSSTRIEEIDEWLALAPGDLGRRAYEQYDTAFKNHDNVAYIAQTSQLYNGVYQDVLRIYLKDDDDSRYRSISSLPVKLQSERIVDVPLIVIKGVGDIPSIHGTTIKGASIHKKIQIMKAQCAV